MISQCVQVEPPTTDCKRSVRVPNHHRCSFIPLIPIILTNIYDGYVWPSYVTAAQIVFVVCGEWGWDRMAAAMNSQLNKNSSSVHM